MPTSRPRAAKPAAEPTTPETSPADSVQVNQQEIMQATLAELGQQIGELTLERHSLQAIVRAQRQTIQGLQAELVQASSGAADTTSG